MFKNCEETLHNNYVEYKAAVAETKHEEDLLRERIEAYKKRELALEKNQRSLE